MSSLCYVPVHYARQKSFHFPKRVQMSKYFQCIPGFGSYFPSLYHTHQRYYPILRIA